MKKIFSIILALTFVFALAACASGKTGSSASPSPSESAQPSEASSPSAETTPSTEATPSAAETTAADDDWAYIKEKGELVIGITPYEPMNFEDESGKLVGFDTEYAEAVCAKLGVTPKFVWINWDTKEVELKAKNIDCIWNGLTVMEERKENMAFTTSYIINTQVVVVKADNASKYTDIARMSGAAVVAEAESAGESAIKKDLADAVYTAVDKQATALLEVKAGTADAAVIDATMAEAMTGEGTDYADLVVVETIDLMDEEYAIGLRLGSTAVAEFNKVTDELLKDGTLKAIAEKYGLGARLISA
jgi:polar amino acid transport system substrate-binding protein